MMITKIPVKKIGMTSAFDGAGTTVPVTLVRPISVYVTEIKREDTHGYSAIQMAYGKTHEQRLNKPHNGVLKKAGIETPLRHFYEARVDAKELEGITVGEKYDPTLFVKTWRVVKVTGDCKGKGFAGGMKRWGFKGQCRSHGDPDNRRVQSNNSTDPARVFKGSKRPGRMGTHSMTVKHVTVFEYDEDNDLLALTGSIPGPNGNVLMMQLVEEIAPEQLESES